MQKYLLILILLVFPITSWAADPYKIQREAMVKNQIKSRGITDKRVLKAMSTIPREKLFDSSRKLMMGGVRFVPITGEAQKKR